MRWYHWYLIVQAVGSLIVSIDEPNPIAWFAYLFPSHVIFWFVPVWLVVKVVRYFRHPPELIAPAPKLEDNEPDDGIMPNMTRKN
jgi:hypothetical protein